MNTQVSLGGSATPMDSLESSVFVWASVLLLVLSAMLVCTIVFEPHLSSLLMRGECMVTRAVGGRPLEGVHSEAPDVADGAEPCSASGAGTCSEAPASPHVEVEVAPQREAEAETSGAGLPYSKTVILSAEA